LDIKYELITLFSLPIIDFPYFPVVPAFMIGMTVHQHSISDHEYICRIVNHTIFCCKLHTRLHSAVSSMFVIKLLRQC